MTNELRVIPLRGIPELVDGDDLGGLIGEAAEHAGGFEQDDVVVVAQKAVSKVEGRIVHLDGIEPSERARELAGDGDPRRFEVILREPSTIRSPPRIPHTKRASAVPGTAADRLVRSVCPDNVPADLPIRASVRNCPAGTTSVMTSEGNLVKSGVVCESEKNP